MPKEIQNKIDEELARWMPKLEEMYELGKRDERESINENTSDGYHSFKELYEFRKLYNALAFNELSKNKDYKVHKSKRHFDGEECFGGGWFIVIAYLPTGQISNHYELKDWDLFKCEEKENADEWDGHTTQDVVNRITKSLQTNKE